MLQNTTITFYSNKPHIINLPYIFNPRKLFFVCPGDSLHISPLERSFKAKVLVHFPSNVEWNPFDEDAVRMVSFFVEIIFLTEGCALILSRVKVAATYRTL